MFDQQFFQNPYPIYAKLRDTAPIIPLQAYGQPVLAVTRYNDCFQLLRDTRLTTVKVGGTKVLKQFDEKLQADLEEFAATTRRWLMFVGPETHTKLRKLLYEQFSPAGAEKLRPVIVAKIQALLDGLSDRQSFDLIADFAHRLPSLVVAHILGMPDADAALIQGWAEPLALLEGALSSTPEMALAAVRATRESGEYVRRLIADRKKHPGEDLVSFMVAAEASDGLTDDDVVAQAQMIITAGHQTARDMIGNGILTLLRNPDQKRKLRDDPGLIRSAVEEILRYEPSIQACPRFVQQDIEIFGRKLTPSDALVFLLAAANRDNAHFDDPEKFDVTRKNNSHLSFGAGAHACIGASIARVEGQSAISELFRYFPELTLASEEIRWRPNFAFRGLLSLPVSTGRVERAQA